MSQLQQKIFCVSLTFANIKSILSAVVTTQKLGYCTFKSTDKFYQIIKALYQIFYCCSYFVTVVKNIFSIYLEKDINNGYVFENTN